MRGASNNPAWFSTSADQRRVLWLRLRMGCLALGIVISMSAFIRSCAGGNKAVTAKDDPRAAFASAIREVLQRDSELSAAKDRKLDADYHSGINIEDASFNSRQEYTQALLTIDLTRCPADFQAAFLRHREAWRKALSVELQYHGWSGKFGGLLEYATTGSNPANRINAAGDEINQSFLEVETVALRYGVQVARKPN